MERILDVTSRMMKQQFQEAKPVAKEATADFTTVGAWVAEDLNRGLRRHPELTMHFVNSDDKAVGLTLYAATDTPMNGEAKIVPQQMLVLLWAGHHNMYYLKTPDEEFTIKRIKEIVVLVKDLGSSATPETIRRRFNMQEL